MKKILTIISIMIAIVLVFAVVFSFEYKKSVDKVSMLQDRLVQLKELSEEIDNTYTSLLESADDVRYKCGSNIKKFIEISESDIKQFEIFADQLVQLIKDYEKTSHYDYSVVYNECDVEDIVEKTLEWREEVLKNTTQSDKMISDEDATLEADIGETMERYNSAINRNSLKYLDNESLFIGVDEIINNEKITEELNQSEARLDSMRTYMIISFVVDIILIISLVIVLIKVKKEKTTLTKGELI